MFANDNDVEQGLKHLLIYWEDHSKVRNTHRLVIIKINQGSNIYMSNHQSANNSFLESQISHSSNSDFNRLFTINLNSSLRLPKEPVVVVPAFEQNAVRLYREYIRQFQKNKRLNNQLTQIIQDRNLLAEKYNSIKTTKTIEDNVHRKRRYAKDIQRLFYCPIQKCKKGYGSEGSLSHHVRLKHLEFHQSGKYEIFIQKYLDDMKESKKKVEEKTALTNVMMRQIDQSSQKEDQIVRRKILKQINKYSQDKK